VRAETVTAGRGRAGRRRPPGCPRANYFAERLVLTIRSEVTDRMLIFGERRHLHRVLAEYASHCNTARRTGHCCCGRHARHRRSPREYPEEVHGRIRRRPILGGLLNEYETAA
jgi:hypothetical protein